MQTKTNSAKIFRTALEEARALILKSVGTSIESGGNPFKHKLGFRRSRCLSIGAVSKIDHALKEVEDEE